MAEYGLSMTCPYLCNGKETNIYTATIQTLGSRSRVITSSQTNVYNNNVWHSSVPIAVDDALCMISLELCKSAAR